MKLNCWEFMKCGRNAGGPKAKELGECVATLETRLHGIHDGKNAGRACWILKNTLCGGDVQSNLAVKLGKCLYCEFYKQVGEEEKGALSASELKGMLG
ncbi:MAG TPA: hypothetical protein VGB23_10440 [Nitrospirota bacterium]|jgi:hypothetical protein